MGFIDKQDDRLGRTLHFIDHALQATFEFAFDAGAGLQQAEVQAQQFDTLERGWHFTGGDAQGEAFDDGGLADTGFADHDRVAFAAAGEDVDHLADRAVAAQHRVELAVTGLLGEVVGEAREVRLATGSRFACGGLRLLGHGEFAQALGIQLGQQWLIVAAGVAHRIAQQGEDQRGFIDLALAELQTGDQQGVLQPLHQFGGKYWVARFAVFATRLQGAGQFTGVHFGILQGARQQAFWALKQAEQQVFHQNLAAAAHHAALGGAFQVIFAGSVEGLHQLL